MQIKFLLVLIIFLFTYCYSADFFEVVCNANNFRYTKNSNQCNQINQLLFVNEAIKNMTTSDDVDLQQLEKDALNNASAISDAIDPLVKLVSQSLECNLEANSGQQPVKLPQSVIEFSNFVGIEICSSNQLTSIKRQQIYDNYLNQFSVENFTDHYFNMAKEQISSNNKFSQKIAIEMKNSQEKIAPLLKKANTHYPILKEKYLSNKEDKKIQCFDDNFGGQIPKRFNHLKNFISYSFLYTKSFFKNLSHREMVEKVDSIINDCSQHKREDGFKQCILISLDYKNSQKIINF